MSADVLFLVNYHFNNHVGCFPLATLNYC